MLTGDNARRSDINQPWEQDNQAWWDWYMTLAYNAEQRAEPLLNIALPPAQPQLSASDLAAELATPYAVSDDAIAFFRDNGFVKLRQVLSPAALQSLRQEMARLLAAEFAVAIDASVTQRFLSLELIWLDNALIRQFVLSPRLAKIAADLLGVPRVRLYHDNLMSKEPGCGRTPWHYDDHHFPLASHDVVTAWIPAQAVPRAMGPLAFAQPIDAYRLVQSVAFNKYDTSYDKHVAETFQAHAVAVEDGPFELGEVSFHHNLSFHTAAANRTTQSRIVLANTYFADGARVLDQPTMVSGDWQKFIPDVAPGERAASHLNPVCWPPEAGL